MSDTRSRGTTSGPAPPRARPHGSLASLQSRGDRKQSRSSRGEIESRDTPEFRFVSWESESSDKNASKESVRERRNSTVSFAAPSLAPSDSISRIRADNPSRQAKVYTKTAKTSVKSRPPTTRTSSQDGTAWSGSGAPLTETNIEAFNEGESSIAEVKSTRRKTATVRVSNDAPRYGSSTGTKRHQAQETRVVSRNTATAGEPSRSQVKSRQYANGPRSGRYSITTNNAPSWHSRGSVSSSWRNETVNKKRQIDSKSNLAKSSWDERTVGYSQGPSRRPTAPTSPSTQSGLRTELRASVPLTRSTRSHGRRSTTRSESKTVKSGQQEEDVSTTSVTRTNREGRRSRSGRIIAGGVAGAVDESSRVSRGDEISDIKEEVSVANPPSRHYSRRSETANETKTATRPSSSSIAEEDVTKTTSRTHRQSNHSSTRAESAVIGTSASRPNPATSPSSPTRANSTTPPDATLEQRWERFVHIREYERPSDGKLIQEEELIVRKLPQAPTPIAAA